jgi:hypothetical protein
MPDYKVPVTSVFEWQQPVEDKDLTAPPGGTPAKGVRYLIVGTGSGAWSGQGGNIATYNGSGWDFTVRREGMIVYVKDEDLFYLYISSWAIFPPSAIASSISDGDTTHSPDGNSVFDALALKAPLISPSFTTPALGTPASGVLTNCDLSTPPAIGETTPNSVRGTNKEIFKTSNGTLTAAECSGTIVSNYGMTDADCTIDLPTAAEGLSFICILPAVRARFFKLHCPTAQADKIYLLGVAGADDGNVGVASGYVTGAAASFFTFKASDGGYDWFCIPIFGNWIAS